MPDRRYALRLLAYGEWLGVQEELVGDLLEEISQGRSPSWVCRQLIGMYGLALVTHARNRARLTPQAVAVGLGAAMAAGVAVVPVNRVLEVWLGAYYVAGVLSLFAHMAAGAEPGGRPMS